MSFKQQFHCDSQQTAQESFFISSFARRTLLVCFSFSATVCKPCSFFMCTFVHFWCHFLTFVQYRKVTFHFGVTVLKPSLHEILFILCHPAESNPPSAISSFTSSCLKSKNKSPLLLFSCSCPKTFLSLEIIPGTEEAFILCIVSAAQPVTLHFSCF